MFWNSNELMPTHVAESYPDKESAIKWRLDNFLKNIKEFNDSVDLKILSRALESILDKKIDEKISNSNWKDADLFKKWMKIGNYVFLKYWNEGVIYKNGFSWSSPSVEFTINELNAEFNNEEKKERLKKINEMKAIIEEKRRIFSKLWI